MCWNRGLALLNVNAGGGHGTSLMIFSAIAPKTSGYLPEMPCIIAEGIIQDATHSRIIAVSAGSLAKFHRFSLFRRISLSICLGTSEIIAFS